MNLDLHKYQLPPYLTGFLTLIGAIICFIAANKPELYEYKWRIIWLGIALLLISVFQLMLSFVPQFRQWIAGLLPF